MAGIPTRVLDRARDVLSVVEPLSGEAQKRILEGLKDASK
jgi:hypothetical protein